MKNSSRVFTVPTASLIKGDARVIIAAKCAELRMSVAPQEEALRLGFEWKWLDTVNHRVGVALWRGVEVMLAVSTQTTDIEKEYLSGCLVPTAVRRWRTLDLVAEDGTTQVLRDRIAELQTELEHTKRLLEAGEQFAKMVLEGQ